MDAEASTNRWRHDSTSKSDSKVSLDKMIEDQESKDIETLDEEKGADEKIGIMGETAIDDVDEEDPAASAKRRSPVADGITSTKSNGKGGDLSLSTTPSRSSKGNDLESGQRNHLHPQQQLRKMSTTLSTKSGGVLKRPIVKKDALERNLEVEKKLELGEKGLPPRLTGDYPGDIVTLDGDDDPDNPKNWSENYRMFLTVLLGMTTMGSTFASSIISSGLRNISEEFEVSTEVATLVVSLFIAGFIVGPVIFGPLSEMYGRRMSVVPPYFVFICFSAGSAVAKDIQTLMITRFFAGVFASAPVTNVGGALSDMWEPKRRGTAIVFYGWAVVGGPTIGPVVGAAVAQSHLGWRWTEYLTVIWTSTIFLFGLFFIPETYVPVILTTRARNLRRSTGKWALHSKHEEEDFTLKGFMTINLVRPIEMFFKEPICTAFCTYNAFAYGILYLSFEAFPIEFMEKRGWNLLQSSLSFMAVLVGVAFAGFFNIYYSNRVYARYLDKHGDAPPEMRLGPMMVGGLIFPIGFFWFAWTSNPNVHPANSLVSAAIIGSAFLLIFQTGINFLIDTYQKYAASAIAVNTFARSIFAAGFPMVAQPLFHNLGINWGFTLLGCLSVLLMTVPFLFYVYGPKLRRMSPYARN